MTFGTKLISVNTPCFNEVDNVSECYEAIRRTFDDDLPGYDYEHIFCDNCSTDGTVAVLREIAARDPRVKVVVNSRNFGLFASMFNGLMHTKGDAVVALYPADLQDPPELIVEFIRKWEEGYQVVLGVKKKREEAWTMRGARKLYYRLVSSFANIHIPVDVSEFSLIDKVVVDALRKYDDYYPYIRGMIANCGFRVAGVEYTWLARERGMTKHRLYHLIDQGLNGIISFTKLPMRICMFVGLIISALSITWAFVSLLLNLLVFRQSLQPGIQSLIVAVFFFSGLQLLFFGVLGEYIAAIHFQVRKRPLVIEQELINFDRDPTVAPATPVEGSVAERA
jgi:glycosyltransferase involved in cell wall biosynthesis